MPHCHCYAGTLRGHCALRGHCTTRGVRNLGAIEAKPRGLATAAFLGVVAATTLGGMAQAFSDGYFLGRAKKKDVSYETLAKRNAALGSIFGTVIAYAILTDGDM